MCVSVKDQCLTPTRNFDNPNCPLNESKPGTRDLSDLPLQRFPRPGQKVGHSLPGPRLGAADEAAALENGIDGTRLVASKVSKKGSGKLGQL